ncbi:hypothetical protein HDU76_008037 [Blyttiomyces sp. JEL0837]|nr:hypothetical protein HDU76_008037 [Blyttiomyces sp. JEL0837]
MQTSNEIPLFTVDNAQEAEINDKQSVSKKFSIRYGTREQSQISPITISTPSNFEKGPRDHFPNSLNTAPIMEKTTTTVSAIRPQAQNLRTIPIDLSKYLESDEELSSERKPPESEVKELQDIIETLAPQQQTQYYQRYHNTLILEL